MHKAPRRMPKWIVCFFAVAWLGAAALPDVWAAADESVSAAPAAVDTAQEEAGEERVLGPAGRFEERGSGAAPLTIESTPEGARVFLDGEEKGVTPLTVEGLLPGPHEVILYLPGFGAYRQKIEGRGGRVAVDLRTEKGLGIGFVTVKTRPADARVDLDGQKVGLSPLEVPVESGRHSLHVAKSGYKDAETVVEVGPGEKKTVELDLLPRSGAVLVISNPPGTEVFLDGKPQGKATEPLLIQDVPPGVHGFRLTKPGYRAWEKTDLEVRSDHTVTVLAALLPERDYSWVRLYTNPPGARVWVDGTEAGIAGDDGLAFQIAKGAHHLRLEVDPAARPGFQSTQLTVSFTEDEIDYRANPIALTPIDENLTHAASLIARGQKEEALSFLDRVPPDHPSRARARLLAVDVLRDLDRVREIPGELGSLLAQPTLQNNPALNLAAGYWCLAAARDAADGEAAQLLTQGVEALERALLSRDRFPQASRDALTLKANYYLGMSCEILFDLTGDRKFVKKGSQAWQVFFAQLDLSPKALEETWIEKARRHRQSLEYLAKKLGG